MFSFVSHKQRQINVYGAARRAEPAAAKKRAAFTSTTGLKKQYAKCDHAGQTNTAVL